MSSTRFVKAIGAVGLHAVALTAGGAAAQVAVLGEYSKTVNVTLQADAADPASPPDAPVFAIGQDSLDFLFEVETEVVLSEAPTLANPTPDVLSFRIVELRLTPQRDVLIELRVQGGPVVLSVAGEDLRIEFRDDGSADVTPEATAPGSGVFDYEDIGARALGTIVLDSPEFANPFPFDLSSFNPFVSELPDITYDLIVEGEEVVQVVGLPSDFNFFGADVIGSDFGLIFFPTFVGDDFDMTSGLIEGCDPASSGTGTFAGEGQFVEFDFSARHLAVADVNNDGADDVVTVLGTFGSNDSLTTLLNLGDGTLDDFVLPEFGLVDRSSSGLAVAHFDGDGFLDAAVCGTGDDGVEILLGNGDGTFTPSQAFPDTTDFALGVSAGDVTGDGVADVVAVSLLDDLMNVFVNDGNGVFSLGQTLPVVDGPSSAVLADLDGDTDLDAAIASTGQGTVSVFTNDGSGVFAPAGEFPAGGGSIAAGDLDGDGDTDLATGNFGGDTVVVLLNDGAGGFAASASFPAGAGPGGLSLVDIDLDGDLDVAVALNGDDAVAVLRNDGTGALSAPETYPGVDNPAGVVAGDLDGDGDPELIADQFSFSTIDGVRVYGNGCTLETGGGCTEADLAEPFGVLDLSDVTTFAAAFLSSDQLADLDGSGLLDLSDINLFVTSFLAGCP